MKNQKGFGAIGVVLLVILLGLMGTTGWYAYSKKQQHQRKIATSKELSPQYKFAAVNIDTSRWAVFEPFQGFTLKRPGDWFLEDNPNFGQQRTDGLISSPNPTYITFKNTYLYSPDLAVKQSYKDYTQPKSGGDVATGARIRIIMTKRGKSAPHINPEDQCTESRNYYHGDREIKLLDFKTFKACQVKQTDFVYDIKTTTDNMGYDADLEFDQNATTDQKNSYINTLHAVVSTFNLY